MFDCFFPRFPRRYLDIHFRSWRHRRLIPIRKLLWLKSLLLHKNLCLFGSRSQNTHRRSILLLSLRVNLPITTWNSLNHICDCWVLIALATSITQISNLPYLKFLHLSHLTIPILYLVIFFFIDCLFQILRLLWDGSCLVPWVPAPALVLQLLMSFCEFYGVHVYLLFLAHFLGVDIL